ncbi:3',5'-cyclic-nucleotide phosphodiesterase PDE1 [Sporobolomyces koalae]|uniref:3',5'-cyclic-nucleotide phosphodiesterase PDE1 n=1 Tax=Sporobolomyces koalae TaxID=500713 RepID=UPI0031709285
MAPNEAISSSPTRCACRHGDCAQVRAGPLDLSSPRRAAGFDLLVLGCGGGPIETNLSCYLVKAKSDSWQDGCVALEGGSTIGAIAALVEASSHSFEGFGLGIGVDEGETRDTTRLPRDYSGKSAGKIWEMIKSFSITHAHLDHVSGLVISSAACTAAKDVFGLPSTIKILEGIMDFSVWPNLGTRDADSTRGKAYIWRPIDSPDARGSLPAFRLSKQLTMTALPISHGTDPSKSSPESEAAYLSTAFFVRNEESGSEFLFFGDVEPDSISCHPRCLPVWEAAASKIVDEKLGVIFLECSYPSSQPEDKLFGHLSPPFVLEELKVLAQCVVAERAKRGLGAIEHPLSGVHVVIQHIKDDIFTPESNKRNPVEAKPRPQPLEIDSIKASAKTTSDLGTTKSPLSMSPPIATVPLRRPSVQLSQFSFPSSSPHPSSGVGSRRSSLFPTPIHYSSASRTSFATPSRKLSGSILLNPFDPHEGIDHGRRKSTPGGFKFGSAPASKSRASSTDASALLSVEQELQQDDQLSLQPDDQDIVSLEVETVEETVHERIERELYELEDDACTGVEFVIARQGMRLSERHFLSLVRSTDPFYQVKAEVQVALQAIESLHRAYKTTPDDWTLAELRAALQAINPDVQELEETVQAVEETGVARRLSIETSEVRRRREFVNRVRDEITVRFSKSFSHGATHLNPHEAPDNMETTPLQFE